MARESVEVQSVAEQQPAVRATRRGRGATRTALLWVAFLPLAVIVLAPLWQLVFMAFAMPEDVWTEQLQWIPTPPSLANFRGLLTNPSWPIMRWFANSALVASVGTALVVLTSALAGYGYARLPFPGKGLLFSLLVFSLMIPISVTMVPAFIMLRRVGVLNTYWSLWFPAIAGVLGVFLMRQSFYAVPTELEDAARVDGATRWRSFWQIELPIVQSACAALAIYTFIALWNDMLWPFIVINQNVRWTLPVGLTMALEGGFGFSNFGLAYAASVIASAPLLIVYALFQRRILAGIATTGLAGQ